MAVLRIHKKQNNFLIIDKSCLSENRLSWGAKGLHAYLMGLPDDCRIKVEKLVEKSSNGRDSVRRLMSELENAGYIQRSVCRDEITGRFGGLEYLVLEIPEPKPHDMSPAPGSQSSVRPSPKNPAPGNPFPATPAPEKTTLIINNKYNNKINKQGINITAANGVEDKTLQHVTEAAAISLPTPKNKLTLTEQFPSKQPTQNLNQNDSIIGQVLTKNQLSRVSALVATLVVESREGLFDEIQHTLLNNDCFKGCGNDFAKKLNAIRKVILRGDWQTPVQMADKHKLNIQAPLLSLEKDLRATQADVLHFKWLLENAKEEAKAVLEEILSKAQLKVIETQEAINKQIAISH